MIVFDLSCPDGHRFEGWFGSSGAFEEQRKRGLVECPQCGSRVVDKAPMAPAVPVKSNARQANAPRPLTNEMPPEVATAIRALAEAQAMALTGRKTLLFVDEIHRFNRAQQDGFLPYVERGVVTLVGATTENPSFALNAALLSRAQVLVLNRLDEAALAALLEPEEKRA